MGMMRIIRVKGDFGLKIVKNSKEDDVEKPIPIPTEDCSNMKKMATSSASSCLDMLAEIAIQESTKLKKGKSVLFEFGDEKPIPMRSCCNIKKMASSSGSSSSGILAEVAIQESMKLEEERSVIVEFIRFCAQKGMQERILADKDLALRLHHIHIPKKKRSGGRKQRSIFLQFGSNHLVALSASSTINMKRKRQYSVLDSDIENLKSLKKKPKRGHVGTTQNLEPTPDMPQELKERINRIGGDVKLVIQKEICESDLSENNNRFSIPIGKSTGAEFLNEREKADLDIRAEKNTKQLVGIPILMLNPSDLSFHPLCLKKWKMGKNSVYNLVSGWSKVAKANQLKKDETVQLWSFRRNHDSQLCFVLVKVNRTSTAATKEDRQQIGHGADADTSSQSGSSTSCLSSPTYL